MKSGSSKLRKLKLEFDLFRIRLSSLHRINALLKLANKQLHRVFSIKGQKGGPYDEWLYRSIIYTLFYANYMSVSLISNQEKESFDYVDTKLLIRAIIERCITQKFILTNPQRYAELFACWGRIESKRFHTSHQDLEQLSSFSLALDLDFEGWANEWSEEREADYLEFVVKWESLVQPKQKATKAKSWSGLSLAEMAKLAGLEDIYKVTYRETSWYSHGLIAVADFFLKPTEHGLEYGASANNLQMIECYMQTEKLFKLSFLISCEALEWNLASRINKITEAQFSTFEWLWEFLRMYII